MAGFVRAGGTLCRTLAIAGYPREVGLGWLEPLLTHPGPIGVALHVEPVPAAKAAEQLRRQRARVVRHRPRPRPGRAGAELPELVRTHNAG